jgi:hypothetical protein
MFWPFSHSQRKRLDLDEDAGTPAPKLPEACSSQPAGLTSTTEITMDWSYVASALDRSFCLCFIVVVVIFNAVSFPRF